MTWICDGLVSVRRTWSSSKKKVSRGERGGVRRPEGELVEVVLDGLDLPVVAHLPAEAEERVLDGAAHLGDRMEVTERQLLAGEGDVDDLLAEPPVELLALERLLARGDRLLEPRRGSRSAACRSRGRVPRAARGRAGAFAPEIGDPHLLELGGSPGRRRRSPSRSLLGSIRCQSAMERAR